MRNPAFLLLALVSYIFISCQTEQEQSLLSIDQVSVEGGLISGTTDSSGQIKIKGGPFVSPTVGSFMKFMESLNP